MFKFSSWFLMTPAMTHLTISNKLIKSKKQIFSM